jgi:hypothetical protein
MASTDYYVVFSVGVDRLIERAGKASGRDGLKGRCTGNDFVAAAEVAIGQAKLVTEFRE